VKRKKKDKGSKRVEAGETKREPRKGRRFSLEQRKEALNLIAAGMERERVAKVIGTTTESLRRWVNQAVRAGRLQDGNPDGSNGTAVNPAQDEARGPRSIYAPKDPGQGLSEPEVAEILTLKKRHPSMGAAQIRAQLKRFKKWRISIKAINRVLRGNGYEPVYRGSRPKGPEPIRFEAPRRNALWQIDYAEVRVGAGRMHLVIVLDDFSRFVVGHGLCDSPSAESAIHVIRQAVVRHGKPEAIRTDRGGGFLSKEFIDFLEVELIDHVVGRAYSPQGGGKVEALIGTVRRELWDIEHFEDRDHASRRLAEFLEEYNLSRAHMGIDGLTPADRFFGRADHVLALVDAISRRRQGVEARAGDGVGGAIEDVTAPTSGAPLEVLRLVLAGEELEASMRSGRSSTR
jgi:transposase InsO family protein